MNDCKISGSGTIGSGEYANVVTSGSITINGNIKCNSIQVAGSCHALGDIDCTGQANIGGSFSCDGKVGAESLKFSGSCRVGSLSGGKLSVAGSCHVKGAIKCSEVNVAGSFHCESDVECDRAELSGIFTVSGALNADESLLILNKSGNSKIESVLGEKITVKRHSISGTKPGFFFETFRFPRSNNVKLNAELIEGDEISLVSTKATTVRGKNVVIGDDCEIGTVEYSESLTTEGKFKIERSIKTE